MKIIKLSAVLCCLGLLFAATAHAAPEGQTNTWADFAHGEATWTEDMEKAFPEPNRETHIHEWLTKHVTLAMGEPCGTCKHQKKWIFEAGIKAILYTDALREKAPIHETQRHEIVARVEDAVEHNHANGVFLDDMNWTCATKDGKQEGATIANGNSKEPSAEETEQCKPTGKEPERKEYVALLKELREKLKAPNAIVSINSHYSDIHEIWSKTEAEAPDRKLLKEAIEKTTLVHQEFGLNSDNGKNSYVTTLAGYESYISFATEIRAKYGTHVTIGGASDEIDGATEAKRNELQEYELATYYLLNDGGDYVGASTATTDTPAHFWKGWCWKAKYNSGSECTSTVSNLELGAQPKEEVAEMRKYGSGEAVYYGREFKWEASEYLIPVHTVPPPTTKGESFILPTILKAEPGPSAGCVVTKAGETWVQTIHSKEGCVNHHK